MDCGRDVGACVNAVAIAQKMVLVRGQIVENQRSVKRTARRDHTSIPHLFCICGLFVRAPIERVDVEHAEAAKDRAPGHLRCNRVSSVSARGLEHIN